MTTKRYTVEQDNGMFQVLETGTSQVIKSFKDRPEATSLKNQLQGGRGFNGSTPSFFLIDLKNMKKSLVNE